jgi:DNA-binding CsgD family transcriptional regulator
MGDEQVERQLIIDLIERECTSYLNRDYETWEGCILKEDRLRRLGALTGGIMHYVEGFAAQVLMIKEMFALHPVPNPESAAEYMRSNWSIQIGGDMAWASFDQYGPRAADPFVTAGLSHQVRILEKQSDGWKIALFGHGDTSLEYIEYPVIRIDERLNILWMNESAKSELPSHPALRKSGARLHSARLGDTDRLRAVATEMSELNIIDYRPSMNNPRGAGNQPVLLEGEDDAKQHVAWVSKQDELLIVSFNDVQSAEHQLEYAQTLFSLSPAQLRLASLVLEGLDMPTSAERLGISLNTAKTHLQRLFDKTGTRSQSALVARLLGIVPPT